LAKSFNFISWNLLSHDFQESLVQVSSAIELWECIKCIPIGIINAGNAPWSAYGRWWMRWSSCGSTHAHVYAHTQWRCNGCDCQMPNG